MKDLLCVVSLSVLYLLGCKSANSDNSSELETVKSVVIYTCIGVAERSDCESLKETSSEEFRVKIYSEKGSSSASKAALYFTDSNSDVTFSDIVEEFVTTRSKATGIFASKGRDSSSLEIEFNLAQTAKVKDSRHETYKGQSGFPGTVKFDYSRKGPGTCTLVGKTKANGTPVVCLAEK